MSLTGKVAVIIGATGDVASGAAHQFLLEGATVVLVGRNQDRLNALKSKLADLVKEPKGEVLTVQGLWDYEKDTILTTKSILAAIGNKAIDHVVSGMGFFELAPGGPTETTLEFLQDKVLGDGFYQTFNAARALLPLIKHREGASFTILSGGLSEGIPPMLPVTVWPGTVKGAALNGLGYSLIAETRESNVRVNVFLIAFGIAGIGGSKNKLGIDSVDSREVGPFFTALAKSKQKGEILRINSVQHALEVAAKFPQ